MEDHGKNLGETDISKTKSGVSARKHKSTERGGGKAEIEKPLD